jgi:hypothetical protein
MFVVQCLRFFPKRYRQCFCSEMWRTIKPYLHWQRLCNNGGDSDSHYLLALATLGVVTWIEMILSVSCCQRWPRQEQYSLLFLPWPPEIQNILLHSFFKGHLFVKCANKPLQFLVTPSWVASSISRKTNNHNVPLWEINSTKSRSFKHLSLVI